MSRGAKGLYAGGGYTMGPGILTPHWQWHLVAAIKTHTVGKRAVRILLGCFLALLIQLVPLWKLIKCPFKRGAPAVPGMMYPGTLACRTLTGGKSPSGLPSVIITAIKSQILTLCVIMLQCRLSLLRLLHFKVNLPPTPMSWKLSPPFTAKEFLHTDLLLNAIQSSLYSRLTFVKSIYLKVRPTWTLSRYSALSFLLSCLFVRLPILEKLSRHFRDFLSVQRFWNKNCHKIFPEPIHDETASRVVKGIPGVLNPAGDNWSVLPWDLYSLYSELSLSFYSLVFYGLY